VTDFTVVIAQPRGYIHSGAFKEVAELLAGGLDDLGHRAQVTVNRINPGSRPILIGCHLLDPAKAAEMPADTIVLNTEQVEGTYQNWNSNIIDWVTRFETWDYSARNIEALAGCTEMPVRLLRLGYHPALARIPHTERQDIDVLFYGSLNDRRRDVIGRLRAMGINVKALFGVYGAERDKLIARSKIILNMHFYHTQIFEIVRVFYLLTNRKAVVAECNGPGAIGEEYRAGVDAVPFEELANACSRLLADDDGRTELEEAGFATISRLPQAELIAPLLKH
jgi:hypothetical protein